MAAVEKICEFSGEYEGWLMYWWKKNHIQINPKFREMFKNARHEFYIESVSHRIKHKFGWSCDDDGRELKSGERRVKEYTFVLKVFDEELLGRVDGVYLNWTTEIGTTKRKLKKLLGGRLNVVKKPFSEHFGMYGMKVTRLPCGKIVSYDTGEEV